MYAKNNVYEIMTPSGWRDFGGVSKTEGKKTFKLKLESGDFVAATPEHYFFSNNQKVKLSDLFVGDCIDTINGPSKILDIKEQNATTVYDIVEVQDELHRFIVNSSVITHNCDEFAFLPNNIAEDFFTSVYPVISSGVTSKITITSTSNGMNLFYKMWTDALAGRNGFKPVRVYYWQYPGREEGSGFREKTIAATSLRQWNQEFGCEFLGSTNTLVAGEKLGAMAYGQEKKRVSGAIIYEEPIEEGYDDDNDKAISPHIYVITVDVSEGKNLDYSAFSVIDISVMPHKQVAVYRNNAIPPILFPSVIKALADYYNGAYVLVETNNNPQVADLLMEDLGYENVLKVGSGNKKAQTVTTSWGGNVANGVKMSPLVKRIGCSQLKTLIENDKLVLLDFESISELTTFVQQGPTFKAEEGRNDDLAMTLVMFAWLTTQKYFKDILEYDLRKQLQFEQFDITDEDIPIGITVDDGIGNRSYVEDGDLWTMFNRDDDEGFLWR